MLISFTSLHSSPHIMKNSAYPSTCQIKNILSASVHLTIHTPLHIKGKFGDRLWNAISCIKQEAHTQSFRVRLCECYHGLESFILDEGYIQHQICVFVYTELKVHKFSNKFAVECCSSIELYSHLVCKRKSGGDIESENSFVSLHF